MAIRIRTMLRDPDGGFSPIAEVSSYTGDKAYVEGAVALEVDGRNVLSTDHWDDINWLWPLLIQALEECRVYGSGRRGFPDQPLTIEAARIPHQDLVRISVSGSARNSATAPEAALLAALGAAAAEYFEHHDRLVGNHDGAAEREIAHRWLSGES